MVFCTLYQPSSRMGYSTVYWCPYTLDDIEHGNHSHDTPEQAAQAGGRVIEQSTIDTVKWPIETCHFHPCF